MVKPLAAEDLRLEQEVELVDVLDLPQLYTRPSFVSLIDTLAELRSEPSSLGSTPTGGTPRSTSGASTPFRRQRKVKSEGVAGYLTKIISSKLAWIEDDAEKEELWETASQVLSERSGRTAMGDLTRTFRVQLGDTVFERSSTEGSDSDYVDLVIHEPALTGDSLGHKTWTSSFLLAQRLSSLASQIQELNKKSVKSVLELGAGTGLVGMAAACVFGSPVTLTDLPEIVPNLQRNVDTNASSISSFHGTMTVRALDWRNPDGLTSGDGEYSQPPNSFPLILAADVVYSMEHPKLLATTVAFHLAKHSNARVIFELPQRDGYSAELVEFRRAMHSIDLEVVDEGVETGFDDWSRPGSDEPLEVQCWWSLWRWAVCEVHSTRSWSPAMLHDRSIHVQDA